MVYVCVYLRASNDGWPFDGGDDPAFQASLEHHGALTWGVCRPDVRNALREGDGVAYFAADRLSNRTPARYQFVGFATVERRVRQTDIWERRSLARFRKYGNLLIRPNDAGGFSHFEPALERTHWHKDWYWRLNGERGLRKNETIGFENIDGRRKVAGHPVRVSPNYIIFSEDPESSLVLEKPPTVAEAHGRRSHETWERSAFARQLESLLLRGTGRSLRTTNPSQAHRHIRIDRDARQVFGQLRVLCQRNGLVARSTRPVDSSPASGRALRCG